MKRLFIPAHQITRHFFKKSQPKSDFGICNLVELGDVSDERPVPVFIAKPEYYSDFLIPESKLQFPELKTDDDIQRMRESCKLAANILKRTGQLAAIGITTDEIDAFVHNEVIKENAYPSPLRYGGFPKSVCTSINNVACHGIPDNRPLMDGDIINIDITVFLNGFHGDCSRTFMIGNVDERGQYLVKNTEEALHRAIDICGPDVAFNKIGHTIENFANEKGLNVIPAFAGHGIGQYFHGPPEILHFRNNYGGIMFPGITFTIEPILTLGEQMVELLEDNWTALSEDGARSAQFEHTILITRDGAEILTQPD